MATIISKLFAPLITIWKVLRSFVIAKLRMRGKYVSLLYELLLEKGRNLILHDELSDVFLPIEFTSFSIIEGIFMHFTIHERILRAGINSTDAVASVTVFRWNKKKLIKFLEDNVIQSDCIPVYLLQQYISEKIGTLAFVDKPNRPYMKEEDYFDIEQEIKLLSRGKIKKTGVILYGKPGNGKTFFVRYLALKYRLPIYIVSVTKDTDNHNLIRMFSRIKGPAIVLFEDFDNYFNGRKLLLKGYSFTFDTILNVIDGVFSNTNNIAFFLTANHLDKIDGALKDRPSRFRFVREIHNPCDSIRRRVFEGLPDRDKLVKQFKNKNLDCLLSIADKVRKEMKKELKFVKNYT